MQSLEERKRPVSDQQKELVKLFSNFSSRHSHWRVFSDFCEMSAIAFSNAIDKSQWEKREERYMNIVKGYDRAELDALANGLGILTMAMETEIQDVLGKTFHDLELHNKYAGQFFTPYPVCRMMAKMTMTNHEQLIEKRGFVTAQEPAVGSGAMVIALAQEMREAGVNYQEHLHVTAIDVDPKCVHMAYVQFSLLHIPAVIIHGNTLSLTEYEHWYTPAHILGGWDWKLRQRAEENAVHEVLAPPPPNVPVPVETPIPREPENPVGQLTLF
jgi:type I restriction-modification system DNA methylase subunit